MKKTIMTVLLLFAAVLSCYGKQKETKALVIATQGNVNCVCEKSTLQLKPGMVLSEGDRIVTENGTADVQISSAGTIRIREMTSVSVETVGNSASVKMTRGTLFARVSKMSADGNFTVNTPTAIAGVRGTNFVVTHDESFGTVVRVHTGSVAVSNDKEKDVVLQENTSADIFNRGGTIFKRASQKATDEAIEFASIPALDEDGWKQIQVMPVPDMTMKNIEKAKDEALDRTSAAMNDLKNAKQYYDAKLSSNRGIQESIRLKNGQTVLGLTVAQSGSKLTVMKSDGSVVVLKRTDIDSVDFTN